MRTITISLSPQEAERIDDAVRSGGYASSSDVVREAFGFWVRQQDLARQERSRLKQAYDDGVASGSASVMTKSTLMAGARARLAGRG